MYACVVENSKRTSRVALADVLTSRTNLVPGRRVHGPCTRPKPLRLVLSEVLYLSKSTRPAINGDISPPFKFAWRGLTFATALTPRRQPGVFGRVGADLCEGVALASA